MAIRTLTNDFTENLPHPLDIQSYIYGLMKIRVSMTEIYTSRNKDAINIEAELKLSIPVYIQVIDQIPEDHISSLITECEKALYFNFELIKAIKETIQKRKGIEVGL